jgi:hypothetical protein
MRLDLMRLLALLVGALSCVSCTSAPSPQRPCLDDPLGAMILSLRADDIETRERTQLQLIQLGPDRLSELRQCMAAADPEIRSRLSTVVATLEAQEAFVRIFGRPRLVSVQASGLTLSSVAAELTRQSGARIEVEEGLTHHLVQLVTREVPVWEALDDLCRANSGLSQEWKYDRVVLRSGIFQELPTVEWKLGPIRMGRLRILSAKLGASGIRIDGDLVTGPRSGPLYLSLNPEQASAGAGQFRFPGHGRAISRSSWLDDGECFTSPVSVDLEFSPDRPVDRIDQLRGRLYLRTWGKSEVLSWIDHPREPEESKGGSPELRFVEWSRSENRLQLRLVYQGHLDFFQMTPFLHIVDSDGRRHSARPNSLVASLGFINIGADFPLSLGARVVRLEARSYVDPHEIELPFEIRSIPVQP